MKKLMVPITTLLLMAAQSFQGCDTLPTPSLQDPIADLRQTGATDHSITVAWVGLEGAVYEISISAPNDSTRFGWAGDRDHQGTVVHFTHDGGHEEMQPSTRYWVQVAAYGDGVPEVSKILAVRTK